MHIDDGSIYHPGGSNNFFVGDPADEMILIDTGDYERAWTKAILDYYVSLGSPKITCIVITHGHEDHTGGLDRIQEVTGAPIKCHPKLVEKIQKILDDTSNTTALKHREIITTGGNVQLQALLTPGHEVDHVCYYLKEDKVMFTGDTVLGASSTSVTDLSNYIKSLKLLTKFKFDIVCPAHGPVAIVKEKGNIVQRQLDHRLGREQQVLKALDQGITDIEAIAKAIYPKNLKKNLRSSAERNVRTHMKKLLKDEVVEEISAKFQMK
jgi:glyoxylase-like metal-dependent hydrolase (beta-lactamase superfamily II)